MMMAKASRSDLDMAFDLANFLDALGRGYLPTALQVGEDVDRLWFDEDDAPRAVEWLARAMRRGSLGRVVMGMEVLLDPRNEMVHPSLDYLAHHPKWHRQPDPPPLDLDALCTAALARMRTAVDADANRHRFEFLMDTPEAHRLMAGASGQLADLALDLTRRAEPYSSHPQAEQEPA